MVKSWQKENAGICLSQGTGFGKPTLRGAQVVMQPPCQLCSTCSLEKTLMLGGIGGRRRRGRQRMRWLDGITDSMDVLGCDGPRRSVAERQGLNPCFSISCIGRWILYH